MSERNFKKESGEIALKPTSSLTATRAFVILAKFAEFYYHKIFEARSWWWSKRLHEWT